MTGLVFLDFDGVLTSGRVHLAQSYPKEGYGMWSKFDLVTVDFLNKLHKYFVVEFVWNTTWMHGMSDKHSMNYHWAEVMFRNAGFQGVMADPWRVNPDDLRWGIDNEWNSGNYRANEVKKYLETYFPHVWDAKSFICLDDNDFSYDKVFGVKRFVKTDAENGMLAKHYEKTWNLAHNVFEKR